MSSRTRKVYLIVRSWWNYNDEWTENDDEPIKAFLSRNEADAFLERCRLRARAERYHYIQGGVGYKVVEMELPI
jgi:hypothetical protein